MPYYYGYGDFLANNIYCILLIPVFLLSLWAQFQVSGSFRRYSVANRRHVTGAQAAEAVLRAHGVYDVPIRPCRGSLTDHYDPRDNNIYLSEDVYNAPTVAAVGVACHEAGHAVQYAEGYGPIRLRQAIIPATQIGSKLVNVLYILDEPSIGLHQRDNRKLIRSLKELRDEGNSVMVVEHDAETMYNADWLVDVGPGAGAEGGKICLNAPVDALLKDVPIAGDVKPHCIINDSLTLDYLRGRESIPVPSARRRGNGLTLSLKGARGNNLKNLDVDFPLGMFIGISGVSGSGKSTLINETLMPILKNKFYNSKIKPLEYDSLEGIGNIDKLIEIDQSPIGRTPRSNPATFTGVFNDIRNLFAETNDAKVRGFGPGRFSFNVPGGRCEACKGAGIKVIEMNFLPSVNVVCDECRGRRYQEDTLAVKYKGKSINDVLEMPISVAYEFFSGIPKITQKLKALVDVGLGYVHLGQSAVTLSGGESQRMKLASELYRKDTGNTLYILDEPTTGLHFEDIKILLGVLQKLVDSGNTVIVIEHNLDVLKCADYIFDLGPEGGRRGGCIVAQGTPEQLAANPDSTTGPFLAEVLDNKIFGK